MDPYDKKVRELRTYATMLEFKKVPARNVIKILDKICKTEGISYEAGTLEKIAEYCSGDLRAAINDLEMIGRGRQKITMLDLNLLVYRKRKESIFEGLKNVFKSQRISDSLSAFTPRVFR